MIGLHKIDLNLLLVLSFLLQTKSVTKAARRLGSSQPSVSRSLAQLRDIFQDPLLIRTNRGMELTRRAEELLSPIQDWIDSTGSLFQEKDFDPMKLDRCFRIASTDDGQVAILAKMLSRFHMLAPKAKIDVVTYSDDAIAKLTSGEVNLVVTGLEPDFSSTYGRRLFTEKSICLVRAGHPALENASQSISMEEFLAWPHISISIGENAFDPVNHILGDMAFRRQILSRTPYFHAAAHFISNTDAILTLPSGSARSLMTDDRFVILDAPEEIGTFDYWLLWHEKSRRDDATMWLVNLIAEECGAPLHDKKISAPFPIPRVLGDNMAGLASQG